MDLAASLRALLDELAAAEARATSEPVKFDLAEAQRHVVRALARIEDRAYLRGRR